MEAIENKVAEPPSEESILVEAARSGDIGAFESLVRRYDRNVFRIAQHITQNREDAEDVVQDAFLKAYQNLGQFQGQSKFYTWLVRIAVNEALMRLRRRRPERTVSIDEDVKTEEDSMPREIADWSPNPEQLYTQAELKDILGKTIQGSASELSHRVCAARCRGAFDRRDRIGPGVERSGSEVEIAARTFAVARASQQVFQTTRWRHRP